MSKYRPRHKKPIYPKQLTLVPKDKWPKVSKDWDKEAPLIEVWLSRKFLVQVFDESTNKYPGMLRMSVNYVRYNTQGWRDGITWEELMQVKRDCGFGNFYAMEIYPRDKDIINVANFRHLWLLDEPLAIGWITKEKE